MKNGRNGDQYSLVWETKILAELWTSMAIFAREVATFIVQQGIQVTLLPILLGALTGPMWLIKLTYLLDNPWGNALSKAQKAGRLLADTLIGQVQSHRPVTLVGFSIGARLIYNCLLELADKEAFGIIDNVYLLGTPAVTSEKELKKITSVVAGTIYNGYNPNDTVLNVLYRATTTSYSYVFGLAPQNYPGIENINLSEKIGGHMEYGTKVPIILKDLGFEVDADTFEDQDAENLRYQTEEETMKQQQKEMEMQEKLNRQLQLEEERLAELEKKQAAKLKAQEQKRLLKEADLAMNKRKEMEMKRRKEIEDARKINQKLSTSRNNLVAIDDLASEELMHMQQVQQMMNEYWTPRELESTLPPLVVDTAVLNENEILGSNLHSAADTDSVEKDTRASAENPPLGNISKADHQKVSPDLNMKSKVPSSQGFLTADEGEISDF